MKLKFPFTTVFLLLLFRISYAQDSLYNKVSNEMCICITAGSSGPFSLDDYKACMTKALQNNLELMIHEVQQEFGDSADYEKGYAYGQSLGRRLDTGLVYSCDAYFRISDTLRYSVFRVYNRDSVQKLLDSVNRVENGKDFKLIYNKARLNFLVGNLTVAHSLAKEILEQEPNDVTALIIHSIFLERNQMYYEAAQVYYQLDRVTGQHSFLVSAAINNRRLRTKNNR
jgi:hypothetical protein